MTRITSTHPKRGGRNTNSAKEKLRMSTVARDGVARQLSERSLAAGRCRPPNRDQDVLLQQTCAGRNARDCAGLMQTNKTRNQHSVPPCPSLPHITMDFRIPRPLTAVVLVALRVPVPIHEGPRNVFHFEPQLRCSLGDRFRHRSGKSKPPPVRGISTPARFLNSVGEPGGGVEK